MFNTKRHCLKQVVEMQTREAQNDLWNNFQIPVNRRGQIPVNRRGQNTVPVLIPAPTALVMNSI